MMTLRLWNDGEIRRGGSHGVRRGGPARFAYFAATALAWCLAGFAERAWGQQEGDLAETLSGVLREQAEAWNRGDVEQFMEAYWKSEHLTFSSGGRTTRGWQATLDNYRQRYGTREKMGQLTFRDLEATSLGPDAAMLLGRWHLETVAGPAGGNFTLIWRRLDGQWRIVHDHTSSGESESSAAGGGE